MDLSLSEVKPVSFIVGCGIFKKRAFLYSAVFKFIETERSSSPSCMLSIDIVRSQ